ncbi:Predicted amidohydrolase [Azospirillum oryzae]|uniref:Predicted amidohydrolase n=1 Tax=Azospirillum oryzae TaxID=286727 RepID=A0A1X7HIA4_9PROT|nr:nitrilase-related carbon-nitrogen hydrolase [Azospirillum oryzae]SMF86651.1 Predicted amidohydrolase [Azospirillum oryzae]
MHPADLFMALWGRLRERRDEVRTLAEELEADHVRAGRLADEAAERLREGVLALEEWAGSGFDRTLAAAQAIDSWFAPLACRYRYLADDPLPAGRLEARRRLNRDGRFNADPADGQLILRPGLLARAMNIRETAPPGALAPGADAGDFDPDDLFTNLLVVLPSLTIEAEREGDPERRIAVEYRRIAAVSDQDPSDPAWTPIIGVVPLAEAEDDLAIRRFRRDGEDWYDPAPRALGRRAADAIARLAEQGANFVLFPEVSVHPDSLAAIQEALRAQAVDGPIRHVLLGVKETGDRPRNRVLLLDRCGRVVGEQTKLHCWDLDSDQCRSYDLRDRNGRLLDCAREDIETGDRFTLFELPDLGRVAVAICEDLGRTQPSAWIASGMMVDWLVTPVMDSGLTTQRWQAKEGGASSRAGYCRVIVANSMALSHRFNRYCRANGEEDKVIEECGVALLFQPRASLAGAPRIACLTLPLSDPAPGYVCARWTPADWPALPDPEPEGCE